ncbi:hypothetical protein PQ477_12645 [Shouchella hunanensis]|uniref:Knr4/Smi1-like domain-containing protein n=2 Tax=Shouchella hunanensis TaxID=766894 RepID=A0ABY7W2U2_9BACI|nr:SMI1/KNR4 family protein [Shouchella hunanensis]WDF02371.1 hypothetical protein PQ477_12645 [Shouchella hunanensis]
MMKESKKQIIECLHSIYNEDKKKLRTEAILFGEKEDDLGWHSTASLGLSIEELNTLETSVSSYQGEMPLDYKNFLKQTNGAYLFDLIHIAGLERNYKNLSYHEETHEPRYLNELVRLISLEKKGPTRLKDYYFFGESFINGTVFAFDKEEKVIEFKEGSLRKIREFNNLDALLEQVFKVGKEHYENRMFIDFS